VTGTVTVDARGLSCPQPVILTTAAIKELESGTLVVLVDSATAKENVSRLAEKNRWAVTIEEQPDSSCRITLTK
jgi:tRNA 2-thiouridine synthesizing protein A